MYHATVAGHAAIRTEHLVATAGNVEFTWEVPSPGEPSGVFIIRMVVTAADYQEALAQVELMLENAEFVARQ